MIPLEIAEQTTAPDGRPQSEQPAWRRDFPIDAPQDQYVARRDFTKFMMLASVAFGAGQLFIGVQNWLRGGRQPLAAQAIAKAAEVPVGCARPFHYPDANEPCLLLRPDEQTFLAFQQKCTHLGCAVVPDQAHKQLRCPCHNGCFDAASGRPLAGPARRPLTRIALENRDGVVYAVGLEETPA
jgi:nitrite reductase/ring-hydroxylating ferredoxin subunit